MWIYMFGMVLIVVDIKINKLVRVYNELNYFILRVLN